MMVSKNLQEHWPSNEVNKWTKQQQQTNKNTPVENYSRSVAWTSALARMHAFTHKKPPAYVRELCVCVRGHVQMDEIPIKCFKIWSNGWENRQIARNVCVESTRYVRVFSCILSPIPSVYFQILFLFYFAINPLVFQARNIVLRFSTLLTCGAARMEERTKEEGK